jgi:anti-sigma factor RsiW
MLHLSENDPRLHDYVDGCLRAGERAALEEHLACCPECTALCRQYQQLDHQLSRAIKRPPLSAEFHARLRARIQSESVHERTRLTDQKRQRLRAELQAQWQSYRRRFFRAQLPGFLDGLGYAAAAAVGGSLLFRLITVFSHASGTSTAGHNNYFALAIGAGAGAVILLGTLAFLAKNQVLRWLAYF